MSQRDHIHILKRISAPTKYCIEPFSTQWRVAEADGTETCYIQANKDYANPIWIRYGYVLESRFYDMLEDEKFMRECMDLYTKHDE